MFGIYFRPAALVFAPLCSVPSVTDKHGLNYCTIINSTEEILLVTCSGGNSLFIKHHAELQLV